MIFELTWNGGVIVLSVLAALVLVGVQIVAALALLKARFLFMQDVFGWRMTGFLGKDGEWFLGFSERPKK